MNARPKKDEHDRRRSQMNFMCTADEKKDIATLAEMHGHKNVAEYMRRVCLGYEQATRDELKENQLGQKTPLPYI